jgi:hypothetical protein
VKHRQVRELNSTLILHFNSLTLEMAQRQPAPPTFNRLVQALYQGVEAQTLSDEDLEELKLVIDGLLDLQPPVVSEGGEAIVPPDTESAEQYQGKRGGRGYVEVKTIKGRQYRSFRYYRGMKNGRSNYGNKYLGKV